MPRTPLAAMVPILLTIACQAVDARADDPERLARLDQLLAAGQAAQAAAQAERWLDAGEIEERNRWQYRQRLGVGLMASGRPAEAVPVLEQAVREAPTEAALHLNLARALRDIGHRGRAVAEFQQAVMLAPDRHDWRLEYAEALQELGIRRDALDEIRRARELCGDCPESLRGEVNFFLAFGDPADGLDALQKLNEVAPSPRTRALLVQTLWRQGDAAAVAAVLDPVPEERLSGEELALLLEVDRRLGRAERALRWVEQDSELVGRVSRPADQVWALLSEICLAGGEAAAALVAIDRALALDDTRALYHHNRAAVLVALGRQDEARRALAEARRLDPALGEAP